MMYRNTVSGAVINVESKIRGNWEAIEPPKAVVEKKAPTKKATTTKRAK